MKTQIIESYQTYNDTFDFRKDFMIAKVLPISSDSYVILKKKLSSKEEVVKICENLFYGKNWNANRKSSIS